MFAHDKKQNVAKHFVKNVCAKYFVRKHFENISSKTSATYLLKDHRLCWPYKLYDGNIFAQTRFDMFGIQNMFDMYANVLVGAICFYSYSLGLNFQQKRLKANKVDDCKCFAHDKKKQNVCATIHFAQNDAETSATYLLKDHRLCWPYKLYGAVGCLHMDMRYVNTHKHFVHPGGDAYFFYSYSLGTFLQQSRLEANKVDCVVTANRFVYSWMKSFKNVL